MQKDDSTAKIGNFLIHTVKEYMKHGQAPITVKVLEQEHIQVKRQLTSCQSCSS